ncbi:35284_t:CDS:2, partial [Racocetra persica]
YDSNPLDPNRDLIWVKNWVRTDEPVSLTQQQFEQLSDAQTQDFSNQYDELLRSLVQNPEATPNITSTIWKSIISNGNTSSVLQFPDAIHFSFGGLGVKMHISEIGFQVDPDFSNFVTEISHIIQTLYEFARKGKFPLTRLMTIRIIKSTEATLSNIFNHDPKTLYCGVDFLTVIGTPGWDEFIQLIAQRLFDKYKAKPHWGKEWENIPNVKSYLSDVLSDQIKQFEKVRANDNSKLSNIFLS